MISIRRATTIAVAAALAVLLVVASQSASAGGGAERLTLTFEREPEIIGIGGEEFYAGQLQAVPGCSAERAVEIQLKQRGDRRYRTIRAGATDAEGAYEISAPRDRIPPGRYYALARATPGCPEVRSRRELFPNSRVTIGFAQGRVEGQVSSSADACTENRTVLVLRRSPGERGFERVGSDRTSAEGAYAVRPRGGLTRGRYFARALEQGSCGVDRSPRVKRG